MMYTTGSTIIHGKHCQEPSQVQQPKNHNNDTPHQSSNTAGDVEIVYKGITKTPLIHQFPFTVSSNDETDVELGSSFDSSSASMESIPKQYSARRPPIFPLRSSSNKYSRVSKLSSSGPKADPPSSLPPDAALILGMERTLFAALNNAWLLAIGGIGLMSVGGKEDHTATQGGIAILVASIMSACTAYSMHFFRVHQLKHNRCFRYSHTLVWAGMISVLTFVTMVLELYFGILSPYLLREKTVAIANPHD